MTTAEGIAMVCAIAVGACGHAHDASKPAEPKVVVPERSTTAGDKLLALVPAGAQMVIEVDVNRLRENEAVGPLARALADSKPGTLAVAELPGAEMIALGLALLRSADAAIMASYRLGSSSVETLILIDSDDHAMFGGTALGNGILALGPPALVRRVEALVVGKGESVAGDKQLLLVRASAMPKRASGAALRISARFDFNARVSLASALDLDAVPATLSLWGDVADDLAVVALLGADNKKESVRLGRAVERWRDRLVRSGTLVRALMLSPLVRAVRVEVADHGAQALFVVGPKRTAKTVAMLMRRLGTPQKDDTDEKDENK